MKILLAATLIALATVAATAVQAGGNPAGRGTVQPGAAAAPMRMADGQVKKVDKAAGKVTLSHGPLENLNMPAMTMVYRVKDAAWLDQLKAGDRIRFLAEQVGGAYMVTRYEPAQ
jgi:Cu(I)/Ag(I) efflux system protein CusF